MLTNSKIFFILIFLFNILMCARYTFSYKDNTNDKMKKQGTKKEDKSSLILHNNK